jgi:hypothetical protein
MSKNLFSISTKLEASLCRSRLSMLGHFVPKPTPGAFSMTIYSTPTGLLSEEEYPYSLGTGMPFEWR